MLYEVASKDGGSGGVKRAVRISQIENSRIFIVCVALGARSVGQARKASAPRNIPNYFHFYDAINLQRSAT